MAGQWQTRAASTRAAWLEHRIRPCRVGRSWPEWHAREITSRDHVAALRALGMSSIDKSLPVSCSRLGAALSLALSRYLACARARQQPSSSDVSVHEALVEVRPEEVLGYASAGKHAVLLGAGGWLLTLMNSFFLFLSSVPLAWFLKTTSSSHLRLMLKSGLLSSGLPNAMSRSLASCSAAACSRSCGRSALRRWIGAHPDLRHH